MGDMLDKSLTLIIGGATSSIAGAIISEFASECHVIPLIRRKITNDIFGDIPVEPVEIDYFSEEYFSLKEKVGKGAKIVFINFSAYTVDKIFLNQTVENFIETYKVNVLTNIRPLQALIPIMISGKWGRIIFVASTRGIHGDIGISSYASSKSALLGLSGSLSKEYGKFGITSNVLSLGFFESRLLKKVTEKRYQSLIARIPGRKIGTGRDVAAAVRMLIASDYINGSVIKIDGGFE